MLAEMKPQKGAVTRIRPYAGDLEIAHKICAKTGLDLVTVLSLALSAGLKAIEANDYSLPTPLAFKVVPPVITGRPGRASYPPNDDQISLAAEAEAPQYKTKKRTSQEIPEKKKL